MRHRKHKRKSTRRASRKSYRSIAHNPRYAIKVNAGNDRNGNPRRAYIIYDGEREIGAVDEGYEGRSVLKKYGLDDHSGNTIDVTPASYKEILKRHKGK